MAYPNPSYQVSDAQTIIQVIENYPLASLLSSRDNEISVSHIPLIHEEHDGGHILVGHLDRNNPQLVGLHNSKVTALFHGPDAPISPNDYQTDQLPTWNFIKVSVKGRVVLMDNENDLRRSLQQLNRVLERGYPRPFVLEDDHPRMNALLTYIQGFRIMVEEWHGIFKLSQEKSEADYQGAKTKMLSFNEHRIKEAVKKWI